MQEWKARILVVDDEEGVREVFRIILEEEGYLCYGAENGEAALSTLSHQRVDVTLLDVMMPGMTGLTLFRHVRERYPEVAVVFSSAMNDVDIVVDHLKNGAYDYIVKPVSRQRLLQAIADALDRRNAAMKQKQRQSYLEERLHHQTKELESRMKELGARPRNTVGECLGV